MAANRGQLSRLYTRGKHTCSESDQDDNSFPPLLPKTPRDSTTISTRPQIWPNPACTKISSHTDSSPQRSPAPASTSRKENMPSAPHVTPFRRPAATAIPAPSRSILRTSSPRYSTRGPLRSFPPLPRQPTSHPKAITEVAEDTRKGIPHHLVPQSREQSLSSDGSGQSTTGKASTKNPELHVARRIPNEDEGGVQAPNPSGPQRSEAKLQDLLGRLYGEMEEDTRNHEREAFEDGERQSSVRKGKEHVWISSEENAGEKVTRQETPFVVSNRLRESRFRAFDFDRPEKRVIHFIGDDEEIISETKIEPREEDEEEKIWKSLEPGVQEIIEQGDYEDREEFLKSWKDVAKAYDGNPFATEFSHPDKILWVYHGEIIV